MRATGWLLATLIPSALLAAPPEGSRPAREYLQAAAQADSFERTEARLMLAGSRNPQVRAFAERMIADHDATSRALADAAGQAGLSPPPAAMSEDQAHWLAGLQGMNGRDLDQAYARQQMLAHRSALTVQQGYAANGDVPALRRAAAAAVPVITAHLAAAEQLQQGLGGS